MCKRLFLLVSLILLLAGTSFAAPVGVFDNAKDIGFPEPSSGGGNTIYDPATSTYYVTGGGGDIWDNWDQFQYAYKMVTGSVRISATPQYVGNVPDFWAKMGVMIRASDGQDSVQYSSVVPRGNAPTGSIDRPRVQFCFREGTNWGSGDWTTWGVGEPAQSVAVQRVDLGYGYSWVQAFADFGSGWQSLGSKAPLTNLPGTVMVGLALTSHAQWRWQPATAKFTNVQIGDPIVPTIPKDAAVIECPGQIPGFNIRAIQVDMADPPGWGYAGMNQLLGPTGAFPTGLPGINEESRIDRFVNLYDTGGHGEFSNDESTVPGIDAFLTSPITDPADEDDDNWYAVEVLACIHLTPGYHIIGANSDDGTIITIGGVEIGRADEWKGAGNSDFLFMVTEEGNYPLVARMLEGGGGSELELHEVLMTENGPKRILLGDTANGGSPVYAIPEPATIALLGLGGLALLGRKKS
jgi:hypothetical protein